MTQNRFLLLMRRIVLCSMAIWLSVDVSVNAQTDLEGAGTSREIWIGARTDGQPGAGTQSDPFNGSGSGFDDKLRELSFSFAANMYIHLLPGTFETKGVGTWLARSGWKIQGAGIDRTFVKLVGASNNVTSVMGNYLWQKVTNVEIADMTVDCNHGPNNPNLAGAVQLSGERHTIRRVKAINANGNRTIGYETFVLYIAYFEGPSAGNLIEDCEVTQFRGTYATAIALGGVGRPGAWFIEGVVRGNRVMNLDNPSAPSTLQAYGAGGFNNVVFENNLSSRCYWGINLDTGTSMNATFRGNQFLGIKHIGMFFGGGNLDNFIIENNLFELEPTARAAALSIFDGGARTKVTNFKIRNNIFRTVKGYGSASRAINIAMAKADTFLVSGNRVESGIPSAFTGPGMVLFDNTDFAGKPMQTLAGYGGNPVQVPSGEAGTLLLNKGSAYVISETTGSPLVNGTNLIVAYQRARSMTPNGQSLSPANRVTVFLWPGKYDLADSALTLDAPYVDLIGLGDAKSTRLESTGNVIVQIADDVTLQNLTLHCSSTFAASLGPQDKAAYFPASKLARTIIKNCIFSGSNNGHGMRLAIDYAGSYENCTAGPRGWGGPGNFSGVAVNCTAGDNSFGSGGLFNGFATNCNAGTTSFGGGNAAGGGFHGVARNCTAGDFSFGGSGHLQNCTIYGRISPSSLTTGKLTDCQIGPGPENVSTILLGSGASLYNCTILAHPAGSGFSLDAPTPIQARVAHCRMNRGMRNVANLIAQPLNVEDPNLD